MTEDSPGPKYNVHSLASNGGKNGAPKFSFAPPSPETKTRLPNVDSPRKGHRESWMSVINRNGVLIMPSSPAPPRTGAAHDAARAASEAARAEEVAGTSNNSPRSRSAMRGSVFGNEHRFGVRQQSQQQEKAETPRKGVASTRVQFVSTKHTRENMGTLLRMIPVALSPLASHLAHCIVRRVFSWSDLRSIQSRMSWWSIGSLAKEWPTRGTTEQSSRSKESGCKHEQSKQLAGRQCAQIRGHGDRAHAHRRHSARTRNVFRPTLVLRNLFTQHQSHGTQHYGFTCPAMRRTKLLFAVYAAD